MSPPIKLTSIVSQQLEKQLEAIQCILHDAGLHDMMLTLIVRHPRFAGLWLTKSNDEEMEFVVVKEIKWMDSLLEDAPHG